MDSLAPKFVLLLALATLALFLFPAASGSFTATHGPTTALRAAAYLRKLIATIRIRWSLIAAMLTLSILAEQRSFTPTALTLPSNRPLRC